MDRVLLVDDDDTLRQLLGEYLTEEGYSITRAESATVALREAYKSRPDLVVMDVMIPGMDGFEASVRLRELSDVPIILLTAKTAEADKLRGFRLGVDDYVTKPFSFAELSARIRAVLARSRDRRATGPLTVPLRRDLHVDLGKRTVTRADQPVTLTATEFRLLECLLTARGQAVSEEKLTRDVWGDYKLPEGGGLRRYIWLLRQKLEADPADPRLILTVRGYGYRLERGGCPRKSRGGGGGGGGARAQPALAAPLHFLGHRPYNGVSPCSTNCRALKPVTLSWRSCWLRAATAITRR
jgi:two-component system KDP operon response regulator KdpE